MCYFRISPRTKHVALILITDNPERCKTMFVAIQQDLRLEIRSASQTHSLLLSAQKNENLYRSVDNSWPNAGRYTKVR